MMRRPTFDLLMLATAIAFATCAAKRGVASDADEPVLFNRDIRPVLVSHCSACHGGVKQAGGISFVYPEQVLPPDGWVIEPGDPDASSLMERIASHDDDLRMPPPEHGPPLEPEQIELFRRWIAQGARWEQHWAFEAPAMPDVPVAEDSAWPRGAIDKFVLSRLEQRQLTPAADASPREWLRRVTMDLTGLPPTASDLDAFKADLATRGEDAYSMVVDRLLASPQYGERWASKWLDVVRYADSKGLGQDGRRNVWAYRDWVIRALNDDLPYDQFTIKQLAGDLLPGADPTNRIATACQRLTATNEEGGTDDEEFRIEAVLDRVNTTWQAWMGASFGCTQCHNHPYDPFRHEDYYRFAAFFNTSVDCDSDDDYPTYAAPTHQADFDKAAKLDEERERLHQEIWEAEYVLLSDAAAWRPLRGLAASSSTSTGVEVRRHDDYDEFATIGTVARNTAITLEAPLPTDIQQLTAVRIAILPRNPEKALSDSEWGFTLSHVRAEIIDTEGNVQQDVKFARLISDSPESYHNPQESLNPKGSAGWGAYSRINHSRQCALVLAEPLELPAGGRLRVVLAHRQFIVSAFSLVSSRGHLDVTDDLRFTELLADPQLVAKRERHRELTRERRAVESTRTPVMQERPEHLSRPSYVFVRGLFLDKAEQVSPGIPHVFERTSGESHASRLEMARWIASRDNPLTARVAVNRLWAQLFGAGLVVTEEDFGSSGEPPSHPDLLDYLARQFSDTYHWSTKQILREMVLSHTYRQSARQRPELAGVDPENKWLARGPRVRLTGEMVRDQALAISGLLSTEMYGPPVHPPIPAGVWKPFQGQDGWPTPKVGEADRYRRSIYTYTKRSIPYPMLATFDSPSREFCTPRRLRSNTPLQALMTLNDEVFAECARALAARMQAAGDSPKQQIARGFVLATGSSPDDRQLQTLLSLYEGYDEPAKACEMVAATLLNLDELLVR